MQRWIVALAAALFATGAFACNVGHGPAPEGTGAKPAAEAKKRVARKAAAPGVRKQKAPAAGEPAPH